MQKWLDGHFREAPQTQFCAVGGPQKLTSNSYVGKQLAQNLADVRFLYAKLHSAKRSLSRSKSPHAGTKRCSGAASKTSKWLYGSSSNHSGT